MNCSRNCLIFFYKLKLLVDLSKICRKLPFRVFCLFIVLFRIFKFQVHSRPPDRVFFSSFSKYFESDTYTLYISARPSFHLSKLGFLRTTSRGSGRSQFRRNAAAPNLLRAALPNIPKFFEASPRSFYIFEGSPLIPLKSPPVVVNRLIGENELEAEIEPDNRNLPPTFGDQPGRY